MVSRRFLIMAGLWLVFTMAQPEHPMQVTTGVQLNLPPLVARQLFRLPLGEIAHQVIAAVDLLPVAQRARVQRLAELQSWDDRLDVVESLLKATFEQPLPRGYRELAWAIARIESSAGNVSIRAMAKALGWSERRLQRTFTEHLGVAPKGFARLVRFDPLMTRVHTHPEERWVDQALARTIHESSAAAADIRKNTGRAPSRCSTYCSVRLRALQSAPPSLFVHLVTLTTNLHE